MLIYETILDPPNVFRLLKVCRYLCLHAINTRRMILLKIELVGCLVWVKAFWCKTAFGTWQLLFALVNSGTNNFFYVNLSGEKAVELPWSLLRMKWCLLIWKVCFKSQQHKLPSLWKLSGLTHYWWLSWWWIIWKSCILTLQIKENIEYEEWYNISCRFKLRFMPEDYDLILYDSL